MRKTLFVFVSITLIVFGCKKTDSNQTDNSSLIIKAGYVCGWGSGTDSLEITKTAIKYLYFVPSKSSSPQISKTRSVSSNEWTEIQGDVNTDNFLKLNYQTCNVCVDGCDEWILIKNDKVSHKITYTKGQKLDTISKLQDKLTQLRAEFNK